MPMPVSLIERYPWSVLTLIRISRFLLSPNTDWSVRDKNLILSRASEALDITSLRNIYFWL